MPLATSPWAKQRRESDINSGHVCKTLTTYCYFPTYPHFQMQQSLQTGMGSLVRSFIHICKYIFVMPDVILYRKCSTTVFLLFLSLTLIVILSLPSLFPLSLLTLISANLVFTSIWVFSPNSLGCLVSSLPGLPWHRPQYLSSTIKLKLWGQVVRQSEEKKYVVIRVEGAMTPTSLDKQRGVILRI